MDEKKKPTDAPSGAPEPDKEDVPPTEFEEMIRRSKEWISKLDEYLGKANSGDDKPTR